MNEADRRAALLRVVVGRPGPVVPDSETWDAWMWLARSDRVSPLLFALVDAVPTDLTDEQRHDVRNLQGAALSRGVRLEHHLLVVTQLLTSQGIQSVVLKGGATAHLDYPDPSWREVGDIDVLVDPADLPRAVALVEGDGWIQGYALPAGHEEFTHTITFVHDGDELDLHQRLAHRALGLLVPARALLDRAITFEVAGVELHTLDDVDRMIHAAIHAVSSRGLYRRLSSEADVLLLASRQVDAAGEVLRQRGIAAGPGDRRARVRDSCAAAQLDVFPEWSRAMRRPMGRRDRLVERAYLGRSRRPVTEELAYLRLLPGWGHRWRYATGYFAVGPDYAAQHGRSGVRAQMRYVASKLRSGAS